MHALPPAQLACKVRAAGRRLSNFTAPQAIMVTRHAWLGGELCSSLPFLLPSSFLWGEAAVSDLQNVRHGRTPDVFAGAPPPSGAREPARRHERRGPAVRGL